MRALAKLVAVNNPDKIIFVGEALVGNEAVDQLTKFDRALRDFSSMSGVGRGIDGMLVTKWDTVDDKVRFQFAAPSTSGCCAVDETKMPFWTGRRRIIDDLYHGPANPVRWLWAGMFLPSTRLLQSLTIRGRRIPTYDNCVCKTSCRPSLAIEWMSYLQDSLTVYLRANISIV